MKIAEELKFKLWGFSSCRMVFLLDVLAILYVLAACSFLVDKNLPDRNHDILGVHLGTAGCLIFLALIFCFLPPFNHAKLYICWPLTALAMILLLLSVPL